MYLAHPVSSPRPASGSAPGAPLLFSSGCSQAAGGSNCRVIRPVPGAPPFASARWSGRTGVGVSAGPGSCCGAARRLAEVSRGAALGVEDARPPEPAKASSDHHGSDGGGRYAPLTFLIACSAWSSV
jgi:hypothetical protein